MEQTDIYKIAITQIPKLGPKTLRQLISYCGGIEAVFKAKKSKLERIPLIGPMIAHEVNHSVDLGLAEKTLHDLIKNDISFSFYLDDQYPKRFKHFADAPPIIFYKGKGQMNPTRSLAIVGTRRPTTQGLIECEKIVQELKPYDITIVSGLAYGIDTAAHQTAVINNMETIGILASGLPHIYPAANRKLAAKMMEHGYVFSEFPPYHKLDPRQFPQRNRVIAMMADAILVVESKQKGGSMITANFGNQYHKDVFALPGRPIDKMSLGCNQLIKQNKAALIENSYDIVSMMHWELSSQNQSFQTQLFQDLPGDEAQVLNIIRDKHKINKDEIHYRSQLQISKLSGVLLNLEFKGLIKSSPGNSYSIV